MIMMMVMMMTGVAFILFFSCEKGLHDGEDVLSCEKHSSHCGSHEDDDVN